MKTIKNIAKSHCVGCGACSQICQNNCISMQYDKEGFIYPQIDENVCIGCSLCYKICPVSQENKNVIHNKPLKVYAAWHFDCNIRLSSSSGGVFTALAEQILSMNGVIFGAAFNDCFGVEHIHVEKRENLAKIRKSKYLQSEIGQSYKQTKDFLSKNKPVLFTGTPCQIAGLYKFLGERDKNLYTCEIVCMGVPSPKIFNKYLNYLEKTYGSRVDSINFRNKKNGWKKSYIEIQFKNGMSYLRKFFDDPYGIGFYKGLYLRPSCYDCIFKYFHNTSDMTIGDFWGIEKMKPNLNDNKGISLLLINTSKSQKLFEKCVGNIKFVECDLSWATEDNPRLLTSFRQPNKRKQFFTEINNKQFDKVVKKYLTTNIIIKAIPKIKKKVKKLIGKINYVF